MFEYEGRRWRIVDNQSSQEITGMIEYKGEWLFHANNMVSVMGIDLEHYRGNTEQAKTTAAQKDFCENFILRCGDIVSLSLVSADTCNRC